MLNIFHKAALIALLACLVSPCAWAKTYPAFGPLTIRNQNPVYLQTLGLQPTHSRTLPRESIEARLDMAYSNVFERDQSATNAMNIDMEQMRLALHVLYGLRSDVEVGIEIPFFHNGGGFLDAFIQEFHKFFGLPNGGRDQVPNGLYRFQFSSGGNMIYDAAQQAFSVGDIALRIKHSIQDETSVLPGVAWFGDIKLPTGRSTQGVSNGGFDFGLGMALEKSYKRIHGYLDVEYIVSSANVSFDQFMRHYMLAYAAAFEVTLMDTWSLIIQLDGGTPLLKGTGMESWDGVPLDLIVGFRGEEKGLLGGHDLIWQAGFSEDVLSGGPSVDFTAFLSIGVRFHKPEKVFNKDQWLARN